MTIDVNRIDDIIHGRIRLGIVAYLSSVETAEFNELREALDTTAGNLSVHIRKLEDAHYVKVFKSFISRKSLTRIQITPKGRAAFITYLDEMRALVDAHSLPEKKAPRAPTGEAGDPKRRRA